MTVKGTDISLVRGDSATITVSCVDTTETIIPLTTSDIVYFTVKRSINDIVIVIQKIITVFLEGKAIISLTHTDTKDLKYISYMYDVQLTRANGEVTTIIQPSKFIITGEVTYE